MHPANGCSAVSSKIGFPTSDLCNENVTVTSGTRNVGIFVTLVKPPIMFYVPSDDNDFFCNIQLQCCLVIFTKVSTLANEKAGQSGRKSVKSGS